MPLDEIAGPRRRAGIAAALVTVVDESTGNSLEYQVAIAPGPDGQGFEITFPRTRPG